jgi:hypothetical protein
VIINNSFSTDNPALISLVQSLSMEFDYAILGKEKTLSTSSIDEKKYYSAYYINKFCHGVHLICRPFIKYFFKRYAIIITKFIFVYLYNLFTFFRLCFIRFDLILFLESEAAQNSKRVQRLLKKPTAYFIYEFYSEQVTSNELQTYQFLYNIEKAGLQYSNFIIGGPNSVLSDYLIKEFNLKNKISIPYSVCPWQPLKALNAHDDGPLKFYYHGALCQNRGLEECIIAFKNIDHAELYIRGFGELKQTLIDIATEHNILHKVFFLDAVNVADLPREATKFDLGLTMVKMNVKNHLYATGFKTFENTSAGLGLIVPASYPLVPLINKWQNGITYEDSTVDNLRAIFNYCVNNKDVVMQWKRNSVVAYQSEFNPKAQSERLVTMLKKSL